MVAAIFLQPSRNDNRLMLHGMRRCPPAGVATAAGGKDGSMRRQASQGSGGGGGFANTQLTAAPLAAHSPHLQFSSTCSRVSRMGAW